MDDPLVSIIIPAYNHEKYIEQAIKSVINQTYGNIELIIIDDGSTDNTPSEIKRILNSCDSIKRFECGRITFIIQENTGLCKTLNKALKLAKGEFIAFLASDDAYLPERIEECVSILSNQKSNVCAVYSDGYIIDENGIKISRFSDKYIVPIGKNIYKELIIGNWIAALSVLYRKSCLFECGLFDENIEVEDYDMLLRLSKKFNLIYIPKALFLYRIHGLNYSIDTTKMRNQFEIISQKYKDLKIYRDFISACRNRNFVEIVHKINFLNIELLLRSNIRIIQRKFGLINIGYFKTFQFILFQVFIFIMGTIRAYFLRFRCIKIGTGVRVEGKITIKGNAKNIVISEFVRILGDIRLITEYSKNRELIQIGEKTTIDHNVILYSHGGQLIIGSNCFIGPDVHIQAKGGVSIGNNTMIAAKTSIFASNHVTDRIDLPYNKQGEKFIGISIGQNCWIGSNVVILDGTNIGDGCIIGANCVLKGEYSAHSKVIAKGVIGKAI